MPQSSGKLSHFWNELRRRNVLRSLAIYAGTAFIILEAASLIFTRWGFPDWTIDLVLWLMILGAFVNVIVAWIYDITPGGMQRTKALQEEVVEEKALFIEGVEGGDLYKPCGDSWTYNPQHHGWSQRLADRGYSDNGYTSL